MSVTDILRALQTKVPMHGGYASLEEASVGYGAAIALRKILLASAPHRMGDTRVVLQGLGTVGATLYANLATVFSVHLLIILFSARTTSRRSA